MNYGKMIISHLPIFVSSSNSDGERFVRRHNVAIIPMCNVRQQTKSMIKSSNRIPPTATAIIDDDESIGLSLRITKSLPVYLVLYIFLFDSCKI